MIKTWNHSLTSKQIKNDHSHILTIFPEVCTGGPVRTAKGKKKNQKYNN